MEELLDVMEHYGAITERCGALRNRYGTLQQQSIFGGLYCYVISDWNPCSSLHMNVWIFCTFGLKMPIQSCPQGNGGMKSRTPFPLGARGSPQIHPCRDKPHSPLQATARSLHSLLHNYATTMQQSPHWSQWDVPNSSPNCPFPFDDHHPI